MQLKYILIATVVLSACPLRTSVATSISEMEALLDTEKQMLLIFDDYIKQNEAKLDALKR